MDVSTAPLRQLPSSSRPPLWAAISRVPDSEPSEYQVTVTLGYLTYQNAGASEATQGVTGYITPKINGVALDDDDVEPLELPDVVSFTYLRVKTTADGMPKFDDEDGPVTIESFPEAQKSVHHVRPSPTSGEEEGDYYFLILETESNGATPPAPIAKRRITGNRELPNQLVEITNIGGKREVYQGYLVGPDDKHELRTLEQLEGAGGVPIIRPLTDRVAAVDPVVDGDGKIITPGTPAVPAEEEGDTIPFRYIVKLNSEATPYTITGEGDAVRFQFTGANGLYSDPFGGQINFDSGLCTSFTPSDLEGASYNVELLTVSLVVEGGGGIGAFVSSSPPKWYIRNGLHIDADDGAAVGTYRVISRLDNYGAVAGDTGETYTAP